MRTAHDLELAGGGGRSRLETVQNLGGVRRMGTGRSSARSCCGRAMDLVVRSARQRKPPQVLDGLSPDYGTGLTTAQQGKGFHPPSFQNSTQ